MFEKFEFSTKILIKEAQKYGIEPIEIVPGKVLSLKHGTKNVHVFRQMASITSSVACMVCQDKTITKKILEMENISTPGGALLDKASTFDEVLKKFNEFKQNVVLKPLDGSKGVGVYLNINNQILLEEIWNKLSADHDEIIIERMVGGTEYRFFATREKTVAVTYREPANVTGDGSLSVEKLVEKKNEGRAGEGEGSAPLFKTIFDEDVVRILEKQGKSRTYVPEKGEKVYLREISNLSAGGDSIDMTDEMPEKYKEIAVKAVKAIPGLAYAGVDMIIKDIVSEDDNYAILEVNSSPGLGFHHFPYKGEERNVSQEILKLCFPEVL